MKYKEQELGGIFGAAYQGIKAPEALKKDALKRMIFENEHLRQAPPKPFKRKVLIRYSGAAAAVLCAVILGIALLRPTGLSYITPMEEGIFYDEVKLENGVIRFCPERVNIAIIPNAGQIMTGQEESWQKPYGEKEAELIEQVEAKSGGELKQSRTDAAPLPETGGKDWSYIGEQEIYVSVLKTQGVQYRAVYDKDGVIYEVTGTDVTQKEFIDYLYQKIKK